MRPPFTIEQFLDVFRRYNEAVLPMQAVLVLVALVIVSRALPSLLGLWPGIILSRREALAREARRGDAAVHVVRGGGGHDDDCGAMTPPTLEHLS